MSSLTLIELIAISYISAHVFIFLITICLIGIRNHPRHHRCCSSSFFRSLRRSLTDKQSTIILTILHFLDVGTDYSVIFGWMFDLNTFRESISNHGTILFVALCLHGFSKLTSTLYIYGSTRQIIPSVLQILDLGVYYDLYFEPNPNVMAVHTEQIYRCFALLQSFPMSIVQTYLLVKFCFILFLKIFLVK